MNLESIKDLKYGQGMHLLLKELFPICRSITGNGVRETLRIIGLNINVPLKVTEVQSGKKAFDWEVPLEWNISEAFIETDGGLRIVDFAENNLHVMGYSIPVDRVISLAELQKHLHSLVEQPEAIPYVTSYYSEDWGFCMRHSQRLRLEDVPYRVVIRSEKKQGSLTYAECFIPGELKEEIFLSCYVCHPSMANNELSGPVVMTALINWLAHQKLRHSFRIVFVPETIGSIVYIANNYEEMKKNIVVGFNLSCLGDDGGYSFVASPYANTAADRIARIVHKTLGFNFVEYPFAKRGSDERQYCSPGIDLPLVTLCRSKFHEFPQYHTSLDNTDFVTQKGLEGGLKFVQYCVILAEKNRRFRTKHLCEPQLGKRNLYSNLSKKNSCISSSNILDFLTYANGKNDLIDISHWTGIGPVELIDLSEQLLKLELIEFV